MAKWISRRPPGQTHIAAGNALLMLELQISTLVGKSLFLFFWLKHSPRCLQKYLTSDTQKEFKITIYICDVGEQTNDSHAPCAQWYHRVHYHLMAKGTGSSHYLGVEELGSLSMYSLVRYRACLALSRPMRVRIDFWFTCSPYLHMTSNFLAEKKNERLSKDANRGMVKKRKTWLWSDEYLSACGTVHLRQFLCLVLVLRMPIWVRSDWRSAFYAALWIPTQMNEIACTFEKPMLWPTRMIPIVSVNWDIHWNKIHVET